MCVCHSCDNGHLGCVNPAHLFLGTHSDNHADMVKKARHVVPAAKHDAKWRASLPRGIHNKKSKLTDQLVKLIRSGLRVGRSQLSIAGELGVHQATVWRIAHGLTWNHVK